MDAEAQRNGSIALAIRMPFEWYMGKENTCLFGRELKRYFISGSFQSESHGL